MPQKELKEIDRDKTSGVTVQITGNNLQRLTGYVEGTNLFACYLSALWRYLEHVQICTLAAL